MRSRRRSRLEFAQDSLVGFPILLGVMEGHLALGSELHELIKGDAGKFRCFARRNAALAEKFQRDQLSG